MILATNYYIPMKKDIDVDESVKSQRLMLKSGMIQKLVSGLYVWTPLGYRVLQKTESIIAKWHNKMGFHQMLAPNLQPGSLWVQSGRRDAYGKELMVFKDRHNKDMILGPTAEEVFAWSVKNGVTSQKQMPQLLYNIQWKYRDEIRPRFGLMRCREFLMCDGYSFHTSENDSKEFYHYILSEYINMFKDFKINPIPIQQNNTGAIGGSLSHEIFAISDAGEDIIDDTGARGIELGHIYFLGTKYSKPIDLKFNDTICYMGCYGVGVSRLVAGLVEIFGSEPGKIDWPEIVSPFKAHIILIDQRGQKIAEDLHNTDPENIYFDNTEKRFGEKMSIADLIGSPIKIIIGNRECDKGEFQVVINNETYQLPHSEVKKVLFAYSDKWYQNRCW